MHQTEPIEAVISGIGGCFPESENIDQLKKNLFDKVDMITVDSRRWNPDKYKYPRGMGKIDCNHRFDATFFGIHSKMCMAMDSMNQIIMERAYEAIIDSGNNPEQYRGSNIAVYVTSSPSENDPALSSTSKQGYSIMGFNKSMLSNRVSYHMHLTGPSTFIDSAWVGGVDVLWLAAEQIKRGYIDGAIVAVCTTFSIPSITGEMIGLGSKESPTLCYDGKCRSFDDEASGFPRSEAAVCFFIQRKTDAKRNYGTIVQAKSDILGSRECSFVEFDEDVVTKTLIDFYKECKVDPSSISFLEADGSSIKKIEKVELNSLSKVFCSKRKSPLLIGSVKSNLGHTMVSSSFVAITKVVIAMDTGMIPPNLHYNTPNTEVPALLNGQMKVVTKPEHLPGDLVAVNICSFNGALGHVLLRRDAKPKHADVKKGKLPKDGLPRIILTSGRHEEGMQQINNFIKSMPLDVEFAALVNNVHKLNTKGHMYRSYCILPPEDGIIKQDIKEYDQMTPKVWFIFSGMGSQWNGMGTGLMRIPILAASIEKSHKVLEPLGIDLKNVVTSLDSTLFNNILNSFVGIAAVQIALVDLLNSLGIVPDGIIGHSVGELGCAYADGCFTAEEMILSAYARGKASLNSPLIKGMMAAIGLGYNTIKNRLPESIEVACHNSETSCTLSGPEEDVLNFVQQLKSEKIFASSVNVANIAFHSRYIAPAGPILLKYLKEVIKEPKRRSSKWVSSSVPESSWNTELAQYSSPEYHTNNLLSSVLFEEACKHIPEHAVVIEVAPHGLLQAILRRSLPVYNIPLTNKMTSCNLYFLLEAIGKMYIHNLLPDVNAIYPPMEYPVSRGTPSLASLVTWIHDIDWKDYNIVSRLQENISSYENYNMEDMFDNTHMLLSHRINNQLLVPISEMLIRAWAKLCSLNSSADFVSVVFEDIYIYNQLLTTESDSSMLFWSVHPGTGIFEFIIEDDCTTKPILKGKVLLMETMQEKSMFSVYEEGNENVKITQEEFYNFFKSKGYQIGKQWEVVKEINCSENGLLTWTNDWLPFLDAIFKLNEYFAMQKTEGVLMTKFIQTLKIDTKNFKSEEIEDVPFFKNSTLRTIQCRGIEMVGAIFETFDSQSNVTIEKLKFAPILDTFNQMEQFLSSVLQLMRETNLLSWRNKITSLVIYEVRSDESTEYLSFELQKAIKDHANVKVLNKVINLEELQTLFLENSTTPHLILINIKHLNKCAAQFNRNDPVFFLGYYSDHLLLSDKTIVPVLQYKSSNKFFTLLKKAQQLNKINVIQIFEGSNWLSKLTDQIMEIENKENIIISWNQKPELGVIKTCKLLAKQDYAHRLSCFFILDKNAPVFSIKDSFYSGQMSLGLAVNVLSEGRWEFFQRLQITDKEKPKEELFKLSTQGLDVHFLGFNLKSNPLDENSKPEIKIGHIEYSGFQNGKRVMGLAMFDQLMRKINPDNILNWTVPVGWNLEDAATVLLAYSTAYFALSLTAQLRKDETVLVNAGHSSMGEAAIAVALQLGGDVFTTVANDKQALVLAKRFPNLKQKQILVFEKMFDIDLLTATKGEGVLVIVNNMSGPVLQKSLLCLAKQGRFVQLDKSDMEKKEKIGMSVFLRNTALYGVAADNVFNATEAWKLKIRDMLEDGIKKGVVKPFPKRVISANRTSLIENLMKDKTDQKKIIMSVKKSIQPNSNLSTVSFKCEPTKSYLIVATNSMLWIDLAEFLVAKGARKIMLALSSQGLNGFNYQRMNTLVTQWDTTIINSSIDLANSVHSASDLLKEVNKLGPLAAIFNLFMDEKSNQVRNIDIASRTLAPELTHFVCLLGGDSTVCDERRQVRLPGLAIQCDSPLSEPKEILKYFQQILDNQDVSPGPQMVLVTDSSNVNNGQDNCLESLHEYLPTLKDLCDFKCKHKRPHIEEVSTLSPRFKHLPKCAVARVIFMFPGVNQAKLEPLVRKLYYPTFIVQLPTVYRSFEEMAGEIVEEILKVNNIGPYSIVSETWSGTMAIEVGCQLETIGRTVNLCLLDSTPSVIQSWLRMIGPPNTSEFDEKLLYILLNLSVKTKSELSKALNWKERLQCALKSEDEANKQNLTNSVTAFHNMLVALYNFKHTGRIFQGTVQLLKQKGDLSIDASDLALYCKKVVKLITLPDASTHSQLMSSDKTAHFVNKNTNCSWY